MESKPELKEEKIKIELKPEIMVIQSTSKCMAMKKNWLFSVLITGDPSSKSSLEKCYFGEAFQKVAHPDPMNDVTLHPAN